MEIDSQCFRCKNYQGGFVCKAFEDIPTDIIITGDFNHTKIHPDQDNDIVFEKIKAKK